jgi:hypothetical protein
MRKIKNVLMAVLVALISITMSNVKLIALTGDVAFTGDLLGGVQITHNTSSDVVSWYRIMPTITDWSNSVGIAFRVKNNVVSGGGSPLHIAINETDSDRIMPKYNDGLSKSLSII